MICMVEKDQEPLILARKKMERRSLKTWVTGAIRCLTTLGFTGLDTLTLRALNPILTTLCIRNYTLILIESIKNLTSIDDY